MSLETDKCWAALKKAADKLEMKAERSFGGDDVTIEVLPGTWITVNVWGYERPAYHGHMTNRGVRLAKGRDLDVSAAAREEVFAALLSGAVVMVDEGLA